MKEMFQPSNIVPLERVYNRKPRGKIIIRLIEIAHNCKYTIIEVAPDNFETEGLNLQEFIGGDCLQVFSRYFDKKLLDCGFFVYSSFDSVKRSVYLNREDSGYLLFSEFGKEFQWEDIDRYKKKRKIDRMNFDYLSYCIENFGIDFDKYVGGSFHRVIEFLEDSDENNIPQFSEQARELDQQLARFASEFGS